MYKILGHVKLIKPLIAVAVIIVVAFLVVYFYSTKPYNDNDFGLESKAAQSLRIFLYNKSVFKDPVPNCWYDSGDYLVFLHRNVQTFYYLSLAQKEAKDSTVKKDIEHVLNEQKYCIDQMLTDGYKQFGDQKNHGINLPPLFNSLLYPRNVNKFDAKEGRDVYLLYGLALQNIGFNDESSYWIKQGKQLTINTSSANCCEEGPLLISPEEIVGIEALAGDVMTIKENGWGVSLKNIALLQQKNYRLIKSFLNTVENMWEADKDASFNYIGGNYDIAGTIALERLYAKETGDHEFAQLSQEMMSYLHGKNKYGVDFTNYKHIYHPCGFFGSCYLSETLINGVDESHEFDIKRKDPWRIAEIQLVGQAKYVLAYILFNSF